MNQRFCVSIVDIDRLGTHMYNSESSSLTVYACRLAARDGQEQPSRVAFTLDFLVFLPYSGAIYRHSGQFTAAHKEL